jgi:Fur family transcriptional regulator, ferric uptake regulator
MGKPVAPIGPIVGEFSSVEEVIGLVRARGGRATSAKRILLEVLFADDRHLSAEQLGEAVQARAPDVHMTTIYRNLEDLQSLGVVVHTHLGHGPVTYQLAAHAHAHLVCSDCGTRMTAPDELFQGLAGSVRAALGFEIDPHHFAIFGRCAACVIRSGPASADAGDSVTSKGSSARLR